MAGQGKVYSREIIAKALNLTEKRVKQMTDSGIIAEASPGNYALYPTMQKYIAYLQNQVADDDKGSDYNLEKARLTRAKREDAELELQVKRQELHRAADVEFILTNMLVAFKAKLETLPHKVLPSIINAPEGKERGERITEVLRVAVDEALNELSAYKPGMFDESVYMSKLDYDTSEES